MPRDVVASEPPRTTKAVAEEGCADEAHDVDAIDLGGDEKDGTDATTAAGTSIETTNSAIVTSSSAAEEEVHPAEEAKRDNSGDDVETRGSIAPVRESISLSRQPSADTITEEKHDSITPSTDPPPATPIATSISAHDQTLNIANNNNYANENSNFERNLQSAYANARTTNNTNAKASANTTASIKSKLGASTTLAALFGGPSIGNAPGVYSKSDSINTPAAQHDYTLVGDSPYDTTYDPQSPYYYNRVFGQLYITTISVMFRGRAFGPIGAIPYERRLLLQFLEVSRIDAYKTTSIMITMNDNETYVFKSFEDPDAVVRLLRRTRKKCYDENQTIAKGMVDGSMPSNQRRIDESNATNNRSLDSNVRNEPSSSADESDEDRRESRERRSRSPEQRSYPDDIDANGRNQGVSQRAQLMPSSLSKQPESMGALSALSMTTPRQDPVVFGDTAETEKRKNRGSNYTATSEKTSKTPKRTPSATPSKLILPDTLRLSMHGNGDGGNLLEEKKDSVGDSNQPRRLFEVENTASTMAPVMMLSPPRTTISQRHAPKTPGVVVVDNNTAGNNTQKEVHRGHQIRRDGNPVAIPSIPTVPSLNTPELHAQKPIINLGSRVIRGTATTLPIPEIDNDDPSPPSSDGSNGVVRVAPRILEPNTHGSRKPNSKQNASHRDGDQEIRLGPLWRNALRIDPETRKDWQVALESTRLAKCDLDDWFDLFFSDDAVFSLARYQLEHVGDRDVSFHPWRRKPTKQAKPNTASEEDDGIPELEREISYIHPIGGKSMIGPSEAETFRVQSLKRYGSYGAILKNVTTVGKSIPMGDCFRVEDRWIIEQQNSNSLKFSVDFRVVFVKRTMFKGVITKNTLSETKGWFQGYSKMLRAALVSPERQELQRRKQQQELDLLGGSVSELDLLGGSVSVASPSSAQTLSTKDSAIVSAKAEAPVRTTENSWRSDSPTTVVSAVTGSPNSDPIGNDNDDAVDGDDSGANDRPTASPDARALTANPLLMVVLVVWAVVVCILLAVAVALWFQVRSVGTSLSVLEDALGELQAQNAMLLQKLEELGMANAADPGTTAGEILLQE